MGAYVRIFELLLFSRTTSHIRTYFLSGDTDCNDVNNVEIIKKKRHTRIENTVVSIIYILKEIANQ